MNPKTRRTLGYVSRSVFMLVTTAIVAIPLYYVVVSTFKTSAAMATNPLGLPTSLGFANYAHVWQTVPVLRSFVNTLIVTVIGVFLQVLIGSLAAYGMILRRSFLTAAIGTLLMITFTIPAQATLIPLYKFEASLNLVDTLQGLVVLYLAGAVFCYFLIVGYMRKLPFELIEAARIDGAGPMRIYWQIVLPLARPILTTVVVFQTITTWNDFMLANVFISSTDLRTIVLQVFNSVGTFNTDWPSFMTITVIALIPVFVFFIFCQRWIVSGLVAGSVKG